MVETAVKIAKVHKEQRVVTSLNPFPVTDL